MSRRLRRPGFTRTTSGKIGLAMLAFVLGVAFIGPLVSPHGIAEPIGAPGTPPYGGALLGTDYLGRDVLSRLLHGGPSVIGIGTAATLLAYTCGVTIGLLAGYSRSLLDPLLMRGVDVLISFPALLVLLLLVAGLGSHVWVLIVGVALVQLPPIARIVRTATLEVSTRGYIEAAQARGERTPAILRREILPNVAPVVLADLGIRFGFSIILVASVNYLGLGLAPPAADWGLMIAENQQYISLNVWSVLAPAIMLAMLTVSVNLIADGYIQTLGRSTLARRGWRLLAPGAPISATAAAAAGGDAPGTSGS
jgi:ABC-type dipeptide/oligopeptide/nickel transport system permease subunit